MYDITQARMFIKALTGSEDSVVTFQSFYDPKDQTTPKGIAEVWHSTLEQSIEYIDYKQSQLAGIYVCINGTDLRGREIYNINNLRVLFADYDGQEKPSWILEPHFTQERDATHGHAFWLIDSTDLTHDEWSALQRQIALFYDTDTQVIDPSRVARLAGTVHYKNPQSPQTYRVTSDNTDIIGKYTVDQIRQAHLLPADKDAELQQWIEKRKGIDTGVGYEDNPIETNKFINFITNAAYPAVLGSGTHELYRVANYGHDHGVSLEHAKELLWEHYNPRCMPPWEEEERHHFDGVVYRAYHYSKSHAGCKTAKAGFQALPPLPEPNCGWADQAKQFNQEIVLSDKQIDIKSHTVSEHTDNDDYSRFRGRYRIDRNAANVLAAQLTMKSSHYDFAAVFDGINYDGVSLIRCDKQYYEFNGKSWDKRSDENVKAEIQRAFSVYKPADNFTSGVSRVLHDHVNVTSVENGTWLSNRTDNTENYTVFNNGIVDLNADNLTLMKHTPEFFILNSVDYDFDPSAKCPVFMSFLNNIWDDNEDLKMQLQEFMGYCLISDVSLQKFSVFVGKSRGGKGTIVDLISRMVGLENIAAPALANLASNSALEEMSTKSLTLIPDAHNVSNSVRDVVLSNLKAITGGDKVSFHEMYKGSRNTVFKTKIIMSTNNVPEFNDPSGALVNRMLVFPFYKSFAGKENYSLGEQLSSEVAGVTQWAIEGLRRLRVNGGKFTEGKLGLIEKEEIRKDMFPLAEFIEQSCNLVESEFTMLDDLYNAYRLWSTTQGIKTPMMKTSFDKALRNSSLPIKHVSQGHKGFHGITVLPHMAVNNVIGFPSVQ